MNAAAQAGSVADPPRKGGRRSREDVRRFVWEVVEVADPHRRETYRLSKAFDWLILSLIGLNIVALVAESVQPVEDALYAAFRALDVVTVVVFTIEYLARMWSCTAAPEINRPIADRLRYARRPMLLIDLFAVAPYYLPFLGTHLVILRTLRLLHFFRIAKVSRYTESLRLIVRVFRRKKQELVVTGFVTSLLLIVTSSLMYFAERAAQPELFSSIPATMWYSIVTLTTVGYGDVYPITDLGRILGGVTAVIGIGFFALPTGILGAGFVEELEQGRLEEGRRARKSGLCPHCGEPLGELAALSDES